MEDPLYSIRRFALSVYVMTRIAKVLDVIGNSDKSWQNAAQAESILF
jgi:hypothetical protein